MTDTSLIRFNAGDPDALVFEKLNELSEQVTAQHDTIIIGSTVQAWDVLLDSISALAFSGNALKVLRVNAGATAFEFAAVTGGTLADGDYGDITVSGSGTVLTIDSSVVTLAKISNAAANSKLVGSGASGSGAAYVEITLGAGLAMVGTTLSATGATLADADYGDITVSSSGTVLTIDNDVVSDAKLRNSAALSVIGRSANSTGDPADIAASNDGEVLRRSGTTLGFGTVAAAGLAVGAGTGWVPAGTGQTATGVYDFAVDGAKANIDFVGLASFNELLVIARGLTDGTTGVREVLVSVDNGGTFYNASGDYVRMDANGVETAQTVLAFHNTNSTAARTLAVHILNMKGTVKYAAVGENLTPALFVASASDINAIRVNNSGGGNITAGKVYVLGR